jgi:hypothetical protein
MSLSLSDLKKSRSLDFSNITKALTKSTDSGYSKEDETEYWKPSRDKAGNGSAVIRFLPAAQGDELPWALVYTHAFKGPTGRWYIENCLSTIGQDDPVNTANKVLWETGTDDNKKIVRERKRKTNYYANVYVVSDPGNRENEGKVLKFKFGKKIFDKIMEKVQPEFEEDTPINVFDLWGGANFKLRIRQVEGYPNYDQSVFTESGPVAETDEEILEIVKQQKPLKDLLDPKNFKSFDELEKKFKGIVSGGGVAPASHHDEDDEPSTPAPAAKEKPAKPLKAKPAPVAETSGGKDDDMEDYFRSISE